MMRKSNYIRVKSEKLATMFTFYEKFFGKEIFKAIFETWKQNIFPYVYKADKASLAANCFICCSTQQQNCIK